MSIDIPRKKILTHLCAWIIYIFYEISILLFVAPSSINLVDTLLAFVLNAAVFYANEIFILGRLSQHKNYYFVILSLLVVIFLYMAASWTFVVYISPIVHGPSAMPKGPVITRLFLAQHIWRAVYFLGLSTGYWLAKKTIMTERKFRALEKEAYVHGLKETELKRQMAVSQLAFIKVQINPHFLHNTLNFFYANIYPLSEKLARSILLLSDIMRYTFQNSDESGFADLGQELKQIDNYIQLNQLRFDSKLRVFTQITGDPEGKKIISFILMTLVENAFKYGDLHDPEHPLKLDIRIIDHLLLFNISNKKRPNNYEFTSSGTGMKNLENHLKLVYTNDYRLEIKDEQSQYSCFLELKLR